MILRTSRLRVYLAQTFIISFVTKQQRHIDICISCTLEVSIIFLQSSFLHLSTMKYLASRFLLATVIANYSPRAFAFAPISSTIGSRQLQPASQSQDLFMMGDLTYGMRKASFGIEDKEVLKDVSADDKVVFVDVRNPDEIEQAKCCRPYVEGKYLLENCDEEVVCKDLPDKDAPHIVFCAKGGRASKACQKLKDMGYSNVYNAGGLGDIDFLE